MSMHRIWILAGLFYAAPSLAQDEGEAVTFDQDMFVIEGKVQKPDITVFISRENLDKGFEITLRESFIDRIVEALYEPPF